MGTDETVQKVEVPVVPVPEGQVVGTEAKAQAVPAPILTAEDVKRIVAEETEKVKRTFQSEKDKTIAQVRRESEQALLSAQQRATVLAQKLAETNPEAAAQMQLADKDAQLSYYQRKEAEAAQARVAVEFDTTFRKNMAESLKALGLDPTDKGIDWAEETEDYLQKQQRILGSAGKVHQSHREAEKAELKAELAKMRRELGLDSVDTSLPTGDKNSSNANFLKAWGSGELPSTKANLDRAKKLQDSL